MSLSVSDWLLLQDLRRFRDTVELLEKRVHALEAERAGTHGEPRKSAAEIGEATLDRLAAQAAANREAGAMEDVRAILEKEPDLTGPQIVAKLPRPLSVRRAQELAKSIRGNSRN